MPLRHLIVLIANIQLFAKQKDWVFLALTAKGLRTQKLFLFLQLKSSAKNGRRAVTLANLTVWQNLILKLNRYIHTVQARIT